MREDRVKKVVILGGGSAGWLVAGVLANHFAGTPNSGLQVTLIESGEIPTLGVGEGTWPSMRGTLKKIGISEADFITSCDASFKQGSKFIGWQRGQGEYYHHPFQLPAPFTDDFVSSIGLAFAEKNFAECVCPEVLLENRGLAPKLITTNDYAHIVNYGYHLDAHKFANLLREHCVKNLGIHHRIATVHQVQTADDGYIDSLTTTDGDTIKGDLFIDCSGFASVLMKGHYQIPQISCRAQLFNDSAIAVQVPYANPDEPINSYTLSTAQRNGWIWDIGLSSRRGVGYTFSSHHTSADQVQSELEAYIKKTADAPQGLSYRTLKFSPGHLKKFWHKNCVAIGVSAGFLEPLEASALVTIELAATMLTESFPATYTAMPMLEQKFNERFIRHWQHIIEFLKLHYLLSQRQDSDYWQDNRDAATMPTGLLEKMAYWRHFAPSRYDDIGLRELFPTASYQYVCYGMGYQPDRPAIELRANRQKVVAHAEEAWRKAASLARTLPTNRQLLDAIRLNSSQMSEAL